MEEKVYLEQLQEIRSMMNRSTKFLSLSGLSGILAGVYAILGAVIVHSIIIHRSHRFITLESVEFMQIIGVAAGVLVLSILTAFILSKRKAVKNGQKLWDSSAKRLFFNFGIPLVSGGIFCITLLQYGVTGLIGPATLIFYGLALLNASKYTLDTLRSLGISFVALGLIATQFIGYSLIFWTIGFGFLHILYGTIMYLKYDRKTA